MPTAQMIFDVIARDGASPSLRVMGKEADTTATKFNNLSKVAAGLAIGFVAYSVKAAADFQKLTNVYVTAAGEQQKNLGIVQAGVKRIAENTGTAWQEVAAATYTAEKAGYRAGDAYKVVEAAAQGAKEENANLATVTNAVTSIMASYHLKASDAVKVTDELKAAAGESKVSFEDFSGALSTVLPIASAAGISFANVAGAFATLTQHGTSANESTQELAATIRALNAPSGAQIKLMNQLGLDSNVVSANLGKEGLTGVLNDLTETVLQKMGPAGTLLLSTFNQSKQASADAATELAALSPAAQQLAQGFEKGTVSLADYRKQARALPGEQGALALQFLNTYTNAKGFQATLQQGLTQNKTYEAALKGLTGGAIGLNTALQLTGESSKATAERVKVVADAARFAGKSVSGWESTQKLFSTQFDEFKQKLEVFAIDLGTKLLPVLADVLTVLQKHPVILQAAAAAVGLLATRWIALKALGLAQFIASLIGKLTGLGIATKTVLAESLPEGMAAAEGAATRTGIAVTGIGTAIARLSTLGAIAAVGFSIKSWVTAASEARKQIDAIKSATITNPADPSQLLAASGKIQAAVDSANRGDRGVSGVLSGALGVVTGGLLGHNAFENEDVAKQGNAQVAQLQSTADNLKLAYDKISRTFGLTNQQIEQLAKAGNISFGNGTGNTWKALNDGVAAFEKLYGAQLKDLPINASLTSNFAAQAVTADAASKKIDAMANVVGTLLNKQAGALTATDGFHKALNDLGDSLDANDKSLKGSSDAAINNRSVILQLVGAAQSAATAYAKSTGKAGDYTKALQLAIPAIEAAATANGLNKDQVDAIIKSLGLVPKETPAHVSVNGIPEAQTALASLLSNLRALAQPIIIPIETSNSLLGVASPNFAPTLPQILSAQSNAEGSISYRGIRGGIVQWAEAGGESFIPLSPAKRARSLKIWQETGKALGVQQMASGGINRGSMTHGGTPTVGNILNIEHYHAASAVSEDGLAQRLALKTRAVLTARRV